MSATVFLNANVPDSATETVIYSISLQRSALSDVQIAGFDKDGTFFGPEATFSVHSKGAQRLGIIFSIPEAGAPAETYFTHAGRLTVNVRVTPSSRFNLVGSGDEQLSHGISYAVQGDYALYGVKTLVERSQRIYSTGIDVALLAQSGARTYRDTGSLDAVARALFYEFAKGQLPVTQRVTKTSS